MNNNNNSNASNTSGGRGRKRRNRAPAPGQQPAQKKQRPSRQNRKRAAKRGRVQSNRGGQDVAALGGISSFFAPVSQGTVIKKVQPSYPVKTANEMRIVHREKVSKLTTPGTGAFTVLQAMALNPGLATSFPWLSNESAGYESYRFHRLRTIWVPGTSTATDGNIIMGPDYDAADAAPVGETALSSYTDADEGNIWCPFAVDCESDLLNGEMRRKFVRNGPLAANLDIKTYDSGTMFVCSTDDTAAKSGKLWVEYDVSLYNPQVPPGGFQSAGALQGAGGSLAAATPSGAAPLSTGSVSLAAPATNVITMSGLQVGQEIAVSANVEGTVITGCVLGTPVGITTKSALIANAINAAATQASSFFTFTVTAPNPTITWTVTATTVTASQVIVTVLAPIPAF